ncbi:division plane positioning ATPase MipZ [Magnetospira thiophila]
MTNKAHIIVLGNEKGGSGKSTTAVHLVISLLRLGKRVATIDADLRQGTLSRYLENRAAYSQSKGLPLPMPTHVRLTDDSLFDPQLDALAVDHDVVLIDCPGHDTEVARQAHARADTLITPLNDSFIDLDVLARVSADAHKVLGLSHYAEMVWEQRKRRAMAKDKPIDWILLRNRLSHLDARNKRDVGRILDGLERRLGFRQVAGFGERVIFRELFPKGLTLLDLKESQDGNLTLSHVAARQEVRAIIEALSL